MNTTTVVENSPFGEYFCVDIHVKAVSDELADVTAEEHVAVDAAIGRAYIRLEQEIATILGVA